MGKVAKMMGRKSWADWFNKRITAKSKNHNFYRSFYVTAEGEEISLSEAAERGLFP